MLPIIVFESDQINQLQDLVTRQPLDEGPYGTHIPVWCIRHRCFEGDLRIDPCRVGVRDILQSWIMDQSPKPHNEIIIASNLGFKFGPHYGIVRIIRHRQHALVLA
ncbi:hypothetical protein D3C76_1395880 [compost metagenome]